MKVYTFWEEQQAMVALECPVEVCDRTIEVPVSDVREVVLSALGNTATVNADYEPQPDCPYVEVCGSGFCSSTTTNPQDISWLKAQIDPDKFVVDNPDASDAVTSLTVRRMRRQQ